MYISILYFFLEDCMQLATVSFKGWSNYVVQHFHTEEEDKKKIKIKLGYF